MKMNDLKKLSSGYSKNTKMIKNCMKNQFQILFLKLLLRIFDVLQTFHFMPKLISKANNKVEFSQRNDKNSANAKSKALFSANQGFRNSQWNKHR